MIEIKDTTLYRKVKNGEASNEEIADYLMKNYTAYAIAVAMAEVLATSESFDPIVISEEQFLRHFRLKGKRLDFDGTYKVENRGRVPGTRIVNGKVILPNEKGA